MAREAECLGSSPCSVNGHHLCDTWALSLRMEIVIYSASGGGGEYAGNQTKVKRVYQCKAIYICI